MLAGLQAAPTWKFVTTSEPTVAGIRCCRVGRPKGRGRACGSGALGAGVPPGRCRPTPAARAAGGAWQRASMAGGLREGARSQVKSVPVAVGPAGALGS